MEKKKVLIVGEKETFLIRVLVNKSNTAGIDTEFVGLHVNDINAKIHDASLVTLYLDEDAMHHQDALHFLNDKVDENNLSIIVIGEANDIIKTYDYFRTEFIYKTFERPVNNEEYIETIKDLFLKVDLGEFKKNILIVDDDPNYLALVREWLRSKYKVSMANSGLQAIKWLGKNKPDLILLDHEMPVTSGPQVLEMLRADEDTKNIPVMFLTGKGDKESVMKVVALKPEGYFLKNIEKNELLEKLDEFFILHKK